MAAVGAGRAVLEQPRLRWVVGGAVAVLFAAVVLPGNQQVQFWAPDSRSELLLRAALSLAFTGALAALVAFALKFAERVLAGDRRYRMWLIVAGAFLVMMIPFWLLTWPGEWVNDDFWIAHLAESWQVDGWQGYLTIVFYTFAMFLYPSAVAVVLAQLVFGALVVGRFATIVYELSRRRRVALVVLVPLLSPAVLVNLLYPMRLIPYAFLLLLVVTELLAMHGRLDRSVGPVVRFVGLGIAVDLLATWRSEGIVVVLLLPVLFVALGLHRRIRVERSTRAAVAGVVAVLALLTGLNSALSSPAYTVVATINPLAAIVSGPIEGPDVQHDLRAVDAVISVDALRANPSYTDVGAYWAAGLRPGYREHLGPYYSAVVDLGIHNPAAVVRNRVQVLLASNALDQEVPVVHPEHLDRVDYGEAEFGALTANDPIATRIDPALRLKTLQALFLVTPDGRPTIGTRILFDALPAMVGLLALSVIAAVRRRWFWCGLGAMLLIQAALVVVAAPGALFMYFLPTYVCGTATVAACIAIRCSRGLGERSAANRSAPRRVARPMLGAGDEPSIPTMVVATREWPT